MGFVARIKGRILLQPTQIAVHGEFQRKHTLEKQLSKSRVRRSWLAFDLDPSRYDRKVNSIHNRTQTCAPHFRSGIINATSLTLLHVALFSVIHSLVDALLLNFTFSFLKRKIVPVSGVNQSCMYCTSLP